MTVKIDSIEPNIFPAIEHLDARDAGRNVELFFECRIEGKPISVTVKLSYEQAAALADLWVPFRKRTSREESEATRPTVLSA